jgi:hypothetical protein
MLRNEDWVEIYYALRDKLDQSPAVAGDARWRAHLEAILVKLGHDGRHMWRP